MSAFPAMVLENLDHVRSWPMLRMEFVLLMADLRDDPNFSERAKHIGLLLADPQFPTIEEIYFVPRRTGS
jgi:hypothetical protein